MTIETTFASNQTPASEAASPSCFETAIDSLIRRWMRCGSLSVLWPNSRDAKYESGVPGPSAAIRIHRPRAFSRLALAGPIGFADAYVDGDWDSNDLAAVAEFAARNLNSSRSGALALPLLGAVRRLRHDARTNTRAGSRRNIAAHYDLGNAFYEAWLDPTMSYSSALFLGTTDLAEAQRVKYRRLLDLIAPRPGDHILEIGCGWGGFAEIAARERDLRVTAITVSPAQHAYASRRMAELGLSDRVAIRLCDYRDVGGRFDAIASIEMIEAVGERYWSRYFRTIHGRLRPGGRAALQAITIADNRFARYRRNPDFIQSRIFPGGMLPTRTVLADRAGRAGLETVRDDGFGLHYAETLARWSARFDAAWPDIRGMGFDARFRRLWHFYLAYCEGGFRSGAVDLRQILLTRT
ncbi:MAG: cyclopropane-fatty-acyl-phospholipid synthase [Proteobacteria bacterium]|nr:cyclopropane-fatty-acyl-phospholipid synthase [Pseudomonadota bacterium]